MTKTKSSVSGKDIRQNESVKAEDIRDSLFRFIQKAHPSFTESSIISIEELNSFRRTYITQLVLEEKGELEIKLLSEKIDHLIIHQNKKLLEIQEVQIDYLSDLMKSKSK